MMNQETGKKKLLLMGISTDSKYVLDYARSRGIYTIATDYRTQEECPEKAMADECWKIDLRDLDELEERCRKEQVTALYSGNNEFCLDQTKYLCRRLGLPFYASDRAWAYARDKEKLKDCARRCGMDVPQQYFPDVSNGQLGQIQYPVMVKPVDSCARRGVFYCQNEEELVEYYEKALAFSENGKLLVEEFIQGEEIAVHFWAENGKLTLLGINSEYCYDDGNVKKWSVLLNDRELYRKFQRAHMEKAERFLREIGCREGNVFMQFIIRDGRYYFLEIGYRLDGGGCWKLWDTIYGFSPLKRMVDLALGGAASGQTAGMPQLKSRGRDGSGLYLLWGKPGKIRTIEGLAAVKAMPGVEIFLERYQKGDTIADTKTMDQIAYGMCIAAKDREELEEKIDEINGTLHMYGEEGESLLRYYTELRAGAGRQ